MTKTVNIKIGYLILLVLIVGFLALPAGTVYAQESGDEDVIATEESEAEVLEPGTIVIEPPLEQVIEEEPAPLAAPEPAPEVLIPPERPPLAVFATWSLLNLILTIATGLIMAVLLVNYFRRVKTEFAKDEEKAKKHLVLRLVAIGATSVAVILFVITQDMRLPMMLTDQYTLWHVIIAAAVVALAVLANKKFEEASERA